MSGADSDAVVAGTLVPQALEEQGVLMYSLSPTELRAVTHLDVTAAMIAVALERIVGVLTPRRARRATA